MTDDDMQLGCCCPCCCFGNISPKQVSTVILVWDMACALGWWIYNSIEVSTITWAPLVINFLLICLIGLVYVDVRKGFGNFNFAFVYVLFRIFLSFILVCAVLAFFIMIWVFLGNPSLGNKDGVDLWWSFWFCMIFIPITVIMFGSNWTFYKAIQFLRKVEWEDYTTSRPGNKRTKFGGYTDTRNLSVSSAFRV